MIRQLLNFILFAFLKYPVILLFVEEPTAPILGKIPHILRKFIQSCFSKQYNFTQETNSINSSDHNKTEKGPWWCLISH